MKNDRWDRNKSKNRNEDKGKNTNGKQIQMKYTSKYK